MFIDEGASYVPRNGTHTGRYVTVTGFDAAGRVMFNSFARDGRFDGYGSYYPESFAAIYQRAM